MQHLIQFSNVLHVLKLELKKKKSIVVSEQLTGFISIPLKRRTYGFIECVGVRKQLFWKFSLGRILWSKSFPFEVKMLETSNNVLFESYIREKRRPFEVTVNEFHQIETLSFNFIIVFQ